MWKIDLLVNVLESRRWSSHSRIYAWTFRLQNFTICINTWILCVCQKVRQYDLNYSFATWQFGAHPSSLTKHVWRFHWKQVHDHNSVFAQINYAVFLNSAALVSATFNETTLYRFNEIFCKLPLLINFCSTPIYNFFSFFFSCPLQFSNMFYLKTTLQNLIYFYV